jgi:hypothetical protein
MATPSRTQKQIAERYKGNLGYYSRLHPWRRARAWVSILVIIGGIAGIVFFQMRGHETFFNSGKISSAHARFGDDCAKCHDKSLMTGGPLTPAKFKQVVSDRFHSGIAFEPIDKKCETCHTRHTLHEPNVVQNRSCSTCHQEHQGLESLKLVASSNCASCHNNSATMEASAQKGMQFRWAAFHRHPHPAGQVVFELPRPQRGYMQTFSSFWNEHPEFQLDRENVRDPDALRFNHQRHFASDIPPINGQKLDCNYCHKPDLDGRYYQRITFAANCQACHSLQFDPKNPELTLPHGNATAVRAFLRTLPTQYADLAVKKGITRPSEIQNFVAGQMTELRERVRSGEEFEREVFFTVDPYKPQRQGESRTRFSFYGCAFCHEVKPVANAAPAITKPIFVDRWMPRANFDHAKHQTDPNTQKPLDCNICHHATQSRETSDVLMPAKANCITCHSPQGKVVAECITCHKYHAPPEAQVIADAHSASSVSVKQMLLGAK